MSFLIGLLLSGIATSTASIVFAGDAMQHQRQLDAARVAPGSYDYSECFADIKDWVSSADYAVVNLETPIGDSNFTGYPCFNAPISFAEALRDAGFDMMLTANNHTLDRRDRGLRRTIGALDSLGVAHLGTYFNVAQRDSVIPMIKDINGFKVGFLNYTFGTNGIKPQGDVAVDLIDREQIARDIERTRRNGAELVAVNMHWGDEYVLLPPASVKKLADFLCKQDIDMVIGGHPHVIQPMEMRHNATTGRPVLLVYSMGNLISGMRTRDTRGGVMVRVELKRDLFGRAWVDGAEYMTHFTVPGVSATDNFRVVLLPSDERVDSVVPQEWRGAARAWLGSALPVLNKHNVGVARAGDYKVTELR